MNIAPDPQDRWNHLAARFAYAFHRKDKAEMAEILTDCDEADLAMMLGGMAYIVEGVVGVLTSTAGGTDEQRYEGILRLFPDPNA